MDVSRGYGLMQLWKRSSTDLMRVLQESEEQTHTLSRAFVDAGTHKLGKWDFFNGYTIVTE